MLDAATTPFGWITRLRSLRPPFARRRPRYRLTVPVWTGGAARSTRVAVLVVAGGRYAVARAASPAWREAARAAGWGFLGRGRCDERVTLAELPPAARRSILAAAARLSGGRRERSTIGADASAGDCPIYRIDGPDTCPRPARPRWWAALAGGVAAEGAR